jgi:hypothetical protein
MKTLSIIFVLAVLLIFSWGILQAATPALIAYCDLDCNCCGLCTWADVQCYCSNPVEGPYTCWDYCCSGVCN